MADSYHKNDAFPGRGALSESIFPGRLAPEASQLAYHYVPGSTEFAGISSDFVKREINPLRHGLYSVDDVFRPESVVSGVGVHPAPVIGGLTAGAGGNVYPSPIEDPNLLEKRGDGLFRNPSTIADGINDRPTSLRNTDGLAAPKGESNILFVDGLPTDCTRREVGHLFRPFIGYKDIKVIHKEPRNIGGRASVLCFVEFIDAKCAMTAMEALQGYKFDDKKPESSVLRIQFAHFPFRPPSEREGQQIRIPVSH